MTAAVEQRTCLRPGCDEPVVKRRGEAASDFARRTYCSRSCYAQRSVPVGGEAQQSAFERQLANRDCPTCGNRLKRRRDESPAQWKKRQYCAKPCAIAGIGRPPAKDPIVEGELDWQAGALCRGTGDSEQWWPKDTSAAEELRLRGLANRYCRRCPVRDACRARADQESACMWGGVVVLRLAGRNQRVDLLAPVEGVAS